MEAPPPGLGDFTQGRASSMCQNLKGGHVQSEINRS